MAPQSSSDNKPLKLVATAYATNDSSIKSPSATLNVIRPKDIVMFVAGTTDPSNTVGLKHQANKEYWRNVKEGQENFWKGVKTLKPQYLDLHIEESFFSWSGDNSHEERVKASERLLDLFGRVYKNWTDKSVHLHLIGHSHGGNVINEFTNTIANDANFPKKWKIKSITYLSTPFFQKQHQLNHSKLHEKCKMINVHNEYDLTQRVIADFTLKNLEVLIKNVDKNELQKALDKTESADLDRILEVLSSIKLTRNMMVELWQKTATLLDSFEDLVSVLINTINGLEGKTAILAAQKQELIRLLNQVNTWITGRINALQSRLPELREWASRQYADNLWGKTQRLADENEFTRLAYVRDLNLFGLLPILNILLATPENFGRTNYTGAYLIDLIASIVQTDNSGITDIIDDTVTSPKIQVKGKYEIIDIPIITEDSYHSKNKKGDFDKFILPLEMCIRTKRPDVLQEVLMRMVSQVINPASLNKAIDTINSLEYIMFGETDDQLVELRENLERYQQVVARLHIDLVTNEDLTNTALVEKPGSLAYLALNSHSLSHTKLLDKVREALTSSFSSGKNPGYKSK